MSATNAERQRAFRARKIKSGEGNGSRLDLVVSMDTHLALKRLAKFFGISMVELLARIAKAEQRSVLAEMDGDGQAAYYDSVTR